MQRTWSRACLYFAHPSLAPSEWLAEQNRLARRPRFLSHWLDVYRSIIGPQGQRVVVLDRWTVWRCQVSWSGRTGSEASRLSGPRGRQGLPQGQLARSPTAAIFPNLNGRTSLCIPSVCFCESGCLTPIRLPHSQTRGHPIESGPGTWADDAIVILMRVSAFHDAILIQAMVDLSPVFWAACSGSAAP